jgi:hypothetical protein
MSPNEITKKYHQADFMLHRGAIPFLIPKYNTCIASYRAKTVAFLKIGTSTISNIKGSFSSFNWDLIGNLMAKSSSVRKHQRATLNP